MVSEQKAAIEGESLKTNIPILSVHTEIGAALSYWGGGGLLRQVSQKHKWTLDGQRK